MHFCCFGKKSEVEKCKENFFFLLSFQEDMTAIMAILAIHSRLEDLHRLLQPKAKRNQYVLLYIQSIFWKSDSKRIISVKCSSLQRSRAQNIVPCTVSQLFSAEQADDVFRFREVELSQVIFKAAFTRYTFYYYWFIIFIQFCMTAHPNKWLWVAHGIKNKFKK